MLFSPKIIKVNNFKTLAPLNLKEIDQFIGLSQDLICIAGMDGYFKGLNDAFEKITGYSLEEGLTLPIIHFVHPDDVEKTTQEILKLSQGHSTISFVNRYVTKNNQVCFIEWKANPMGTLIYAIGRDITKSKLLEKSLIEAKNKIESDFRAQELFISNISHELRNPIHAVSGFIDLLEKSPMDEHQKKYLAIVKATYLNVHKLLNDIGDYSKNINNQIHLNVLLDYIEVAFQDVLISNLLLAREKKIEIRTEFNVSTDSFYFDSLRVKQILQNLISNAIKFSKEHGAIYVGMNELYDKTSPYTLEISIVDQGVGMDEGFQKNLFKPFTQEQVGYANKTKGLGLGLSIVKQLVEKMNGQIEIESRPGQGTRVTLCFPFEKHQFYSKMKRSDSIFVPAFDRLADKIPLKILIVEDDPVNQQLFELYLQKLGYQPLVTSSGVEAVQLALENEFDVIFMDIQMPIMDGVETTQKIRLLKNESPLKIIATTAYEDPADHQKFIKSGMDTVITKPFSVEKIYNYLTEQFLPK